MSYKKELTAQMSENGELRQNEKQAQLLEGRKNRMMID
jgi:hypothetical protein